MARLKRLYAIDKPMGAAAVGCDAPFVCLLGGGMAAQNVQLGF